MKLKEAVFYMTHNGCAYSVAFDGDRVHVYWGTAAWLVSDADRHPTPNATNAARAIRLVLAGKASEVPK